MPKTITVAHKKGTWVKRRPIASAQLDEGEREYLKQGDRLIIAATANDLERGHLLVTLSQKEGRKTVDGRNTFYIWPSHFDGLDLASIRTSKKRPAASYTTITANATELMHTAEGYSDRVYLCPANLPTVGWGHMSRSLRVGDRLSQRECVQLWEDDIEKFINGVGQLLTIPVTHQAFSSTVSFAYNTGLAALAESTLLRKVNAGDEEAPKVELMRWVRGGGRKLPGLVKRRWWECHLWYGGEFDRARWDSFYPGDVDHYDPSQLK